MVFTKQDFLDFKFGGHWASEYGLIRVSNSKRYDANITPTLTDKTVEVPGNDGMYFFSTYHKQRQFTVNVAFDHVTEVQLRAIRVWLSGKEIKDLIFVEDLEKNASDIPQEDRGRKYHAKVTGAPSFKYVPFDETNRESSTNVTPTSPSSDPLTSQVIYKGEGTVQFTCYDPYAYSIEQFNAADDPTVGGEVPTPFILTTSDSVNANTTITISNGGNILSSITITNQTSTNVEWNSNTGIVKDGTSPIAFLGNSMILLPVGAEISITISGTSGLTCNLIYYNRYY